MMMMTLMMMMILLLVSQHALGGVVEVNEGAESVLLPCVYSDNPPGDPFLIWTRSDLSPNSVHLRRENSDDLKNQNQRFRNRTSMNPDALDTGNFSLTLRKPQQSDGGNYTCSISDGREGREVKQIHLKVKVDQQEVEVTEGSDSVILPCTTSSHLPEDTLVEWTRSESECMMVHSSNQRNQDGFCSHRTKMNKDFLRTGDVSLTLMYPTHRDDGRYVCTVYRDQDVLRHTVVLKYVKKEPFPSWATALLVLLVLLVLVLIVSAGVLYHFKDYFLPAPLKVDPGVKSVLLPCRTIVCLPGGSRVEWRDGENKLVHVYLKGSDYPEEQNLTSGTRTRMGKNPLKTKDLSLTLERPSVADRGIYTCRVRKGITLMMKRVHLQFKVAVVDQLQMKGTISLLSPAVNVQFHLKQLIVLVRLLQVQLIKLHFTKISASCSTASSPASIERISAEYGPPDSETPFRSSAELWDSHLMMETTHNL